MGQGNDVDTIIHEHLRTKHKAIEEAAKRDVLVIHGPIMPFLDHEVRDAFAPFKIVMIRNASSW